MKPPTKRKAVRKREKPASESAFSLRMTDSLRAMVDMEAKKDNRSTNNMLIRLCVEALKARGAYVNPRIQ